MGKQLLVFTSPNIRHIPFLIYRIRLIWLRVNSGYFQNSRDHSGESVLGRLRKYKKSKTPPARLPEGDYLACFEDCIVLEEQIQIFQPTNKFTLFLPAVRVVFLSTLIFLEF